ncbi:hypothetical protein H9P43_007269 [Blastocladiella emersonii ATCC 22665]|nr:hypothetical protein H9P43_007269 [Blastocladiella emersonii ATCC 22665]
MPNATPESTAGSSREPGPLAPNERPVIVVPELPLPTPPASAAPPSPDVSAPQSRTAETVAEWAYYQALVDVLTQEHALAPLSAAPLPVGTAPGADELLDSLVSTLDRHSSRKLKLLSGRTTRFGSTIYERPLLIGSLIRKHSARVTREASSPPAGDSAIRFALASLLADVERGRVPQTISTDYISKDRRTPVDVHAPFIRLNGAVVYNFRALGDHARASAVAEAALALTSAPARIQPASRRPAILVDVDSELELPLAYLNSSDARESQDKLENEPDEDGRVATTPDATMPSDATADLDNDRDSDRSSLPPEPRRPVATRSSAKRRKRPADGSPALPSAKRHAAAALPPTRSSPAAAVAAASDASALTPAPATLAPGQLPAEFLDRARSLPASRMTFLMIAHELSNALDLDSQQDVVEAATDAAFLGWATEKFIGFLNTLAAPAKE